MRRLNVPRVHWSTRRSLAKPSAIHAALNSNNPKTQQNTPRVQIKLIQYGPDSVWARSQTLKAHAPTESINPKRLMEPAVYRNLLKLFCAINLCRLSA